MKQKIKNVDEFYTKYDWVALRPLHGINFNHIDDKLKIWNSQWVNDKANASRESWQTMSNMSKSIL